MRNRKHVLIVLPKLQVGGAERVVTEIANGLVEDGASVTMFSVVAGEQKVPFTLDPRIEQKHLSSGCKHVTHSRLLGFFYRVVSIRRVIKEHSPDVVLSFLTSINNLVLLSSIGLGVPVVVSERTNPAQHRCGIATSTLRKVVYRRASCVVLQTRGAAEWMTRRVRCTAKVIPNFIPAYRLGGDTTEWEGQNSEIIVSVGRLVPEKAFDDLIKAFAMVVQRLSGLRLRIVGDGPERDVLWQLAIKSSVSESIEFVDELTDVGKVLVSGGVYVQSSRREGFPNALLEAMWLGVPVVASQAAGSMLIDQAVNGKIYPTGNITALAASIEDLMRNRTLSAELGSNAKKVKESYSENVVLPMWKETLFLGSSGCS